MLLGADASNNMKIKARQKVMAKRPGSSVVRADGVMSHQVASSILARVASLQGCEIRKQNRPRTESFWNILTAKANLLRLIFINTNERRPVMKTEGTRD